MINDNFHLIITIKKPFFKIRRFLKMALYDKIEISKTIHSMNVNSNNKRFIDAVISFLEK